ncbi:MAG: hypothetical protein WCS95_07770 [Lentisphaeria bacterium]
MVRTDAYIDMSVAEARISALQNEREVPVHRTGKEFIKAKKKVEGLLVNTYRIFLADARRAANKQPLLNVPIKRIRQRKKIKQYQAFHDQATLAKLAKITPKMMTLIKQEWEAFKTNDETYATYLLLFDFFVKQKFEPDAVFEFHDAHKSLLREVGLEDDY